MDALSTNTKKQLKRRFSKWIFGSAYYKTETTIYAVEEGWMCYDSEYKVKIKDYSNCQ